MIQRRSIRIPRRSVLAAGLAGVAAACRRPAAPGFTPEQLALTPWERVTARARGTTVRFGAWAGDEERNRYFRTSVVESVRTRCSVALVMTPFADTSDAINKLLDEKRAGKNTAGSLDILWINGENFRAAKQGALLWGPFAASLPSIGLYDEAIRGRDFGTPIGDYEAPWQCSQFVLAYDSARVPEPPRTVAALREWAAQHPGRFTYIAPPDFTGSAFVRHVLMYFGGGAEPFGKGFDEQLYRHASEGAIGWLRGIRPHLWRRGETYPSTVREQDRLFANQEIDFAMSYGPDFASRRIARGEFPPSTRTFVFDSGTLGNYNFLAIPFNASNLPGALAVINHLMSFDQLLDLSRALGSPFPLRPDRLTPEQRALADALPRGPATLSAEVLSRHFLPEPDAAYVDRFEKDWLARVLRP